MKYLKVNLWGREIGRLAWNPSIRRIYFTYNKNLKAEIPDIAPLLSPAARRNINLPIYGDDNPAYQGLPPFIADSLPDSWGNTLFERWINDNKIPRSQVTPLYKLMFIGTRGMGALEFEPSDADLATGRRVDIKSLYDLSLKILQERDDIVLSSHDPLTMQAMLAVGTSAGGRQMKAIVAINEATGEIRSGQANCLEGFEHYIIKFGDRSMPIAEIEAAYHKMAIAAGIEMEPCRLLPVEGVNHFITRRFDRRNGRKLHMQTLAAINPDARSYEDMADTCRLLHLSECEIDQLFTRMVFNVMANNTDDHNKNFSFLLEEQGKWQLAPAYDLTFIFNTYGTGPNIEHRMSIGGKTSGITKADLLDFARKNEIRNASSIIDSVAEAIMNFEEFASAANVSSPWRGIIQKTLNQNLASMGYTCATKEPAHPIADKYGRTIIDISVSINSKGYYIVTAIIDGIQYRRFIKPGTSTFSDLSKTDISNLQAEEKVTLIEALFPPQPS